MASQTRVIISPISGGCVVRAHNGCIHTPSDFSEVEGNCSPFSCMILLTARGSLSYSGKQPQAAAACRVLYWGASFERRWWAHSKA